jgi:translation initiation factor 1
MQATHLSKVGFFFLSSCCRNNPFPIAASELECRRPKICSREQAVVVVVVAGDNKRQPNYIDIGVGSRAACDEVKIVRISSQQPLEGPTKSKSSSKRNPPPLKRRTSLSTVDLKPEQQNLVIEATKRGRGGKTVTVIKGLQLKQDSLDALCKALKMKIGSGGTVKDGEIELQGNHSVMLVDELVKLGYKAKKSGR